MELYQHSPDPFDEDQSEGDEFHNLKSVNNAQS